MKTSRLISFTGSMAALTVMTVLSVLIGQVRGWRTGEGEAGRHIRRSTPFSFSTTRSTHAPLQTTTPHEQVFHAIPQGLAGGIKFDQWVAVLAFSYFGLKTLKVRPCLTALA